VIRIPDSALVLLIGASGSGKSTFAARHFGADAVVSSDQLRGLIAGEYVVNVNHYLATTPDPVPVSVKVEKINPKVEVIYYERLTLDHTGDEKTAVRFTIGADGKVTDINTRPKSLIRETRKVRSNIIPVTGAAQHP